MNTRSPAASGRSPKVAPGRSSRAEEKSRAKQADRSMKTTSHPISRREAIKAVAVAAAAFTIVPRHVLGGQGQTPPSEKLNIAGVGVGGMGSGDIRSVASENVVALCDVDEQALARNAKDFPKAKRHADFRKMLETQNDIDAVVVATPDHNHAAVSIIAMN